MSKSNTKNQVFVSTITVAEAGRKVLYHTLYKVMNITGISKAKVDELRDIAGDNLIRAIKVTKIVNPHGAETITYEPVFIETKKESTAVKVETFADFLTALSKVSDSKTLIDEIQFTLVNGVSLKKLMATPESYISFEFVPVLKKLNATLDVSRITVPTRESALVWTADLATGELTEINGEEEVLVKASYDIRSENAVMESLALNYVMITRNERTGEIGILSKGDSALVMKYGVRLTKRSFSYENVTYTVVKDLRYQMSVDYNIPLLDGATELSFAERKMQDYALQKGVMFEFEGNPLRAKYWMSSPSQERQVMGTHIIGMDPVVALEKIGMDYRQFANFDGEYYTIDMMKAPKRLGLSLSSSVKSNLIKIGNKIKEYENGSFAIVGGTHTMLCTKDVYSYVKTGHYMAYDMATGKLKKVNAAELPVKRNATDGMIFADYTIQATLYAEFGKLLASEQVRITPATKGLIVFVPGLKDKVGHDLLAFESATKGDYKTLLRTNPDYEIEFRIASFGHDASEMAREKEMPYQMWQTLNVDLDLLKERVTEKVEQKLELYDDKEQLIKYLGLSALESVSELSPEELTEEDTALLDSTLVSMFTKYLYTNDVIFNDPYFKKKVIDIIKTTITKWAQGSIPVKGNYRYVSTDVYGVLESMKMGNLAIEKGYKSEFVEYDKEGNARNIVVPSHVGIPANHAVMVDDNDKYFLDGTTVICQRNPKVSPKETAKVTTIIVREYYEARKKHKFAFNNIIFMSCHDFEGIRQGGLDFDGDKSLTSSDPLLVNSYVEQPALFSINIMEDGSMVEGCPWQPKVIAEYINHAKQTYRSDVVVNGNVINDEFKVKFTDADYNLDFARQLHELSKVFTLRSLQPNQIGMITDFATKILAAISRLNYHLSTNTDVDGNELTSEIREHYITSNDKMYDMVDRLALAQGWEIDKPKHGGEFWKYFDLKFISEQDHFPEFASEVVLNKYDKPVKRYLKLEWLVAARTKDCFKVLEGKVLPSFMQSVRNLILDIYTDKLEVRFNSMDAADGKFNLINAFTPYVVMNDHREMNAVRKNLVQIMKVYGEGQKSVMDLRAKFETQRKDYAKKHLNNRKAMLMYDRYAKFTINQLLDKVVLEAQQQVKTISFGEGAKFDEATVAYLAYNIKYNNYDVNKANQAKAPAMGLSFPWVVCQDGMMDLLSRLANKEVNTALLSPVVANGQKIRIHGLDNTNLSAEQIWNLAWTANQGQHGLAVWLKEDPDTNNVLPFVYAGQHVIGFIGSDYVHYLSGSDKFTVRFSNMEMSDSGKSASMYLSEVKRIVQ